MKYWITEQGEKIDIQEMSKEHIHNSIKMLMKNIRNGEYLFEGGKERVKRARVYIGVLERELERRKKKFTPLRRKLESLL